MADRVFLDANVLFSAAYTDDSRLQELWRLPEVELFTSAFALEEARRNLQLHNPEAVAILDRLVTGLTVTPEVAVGALPDEVELLEKDRPILLAAIVSGCSHLLTGDKRHFGSLYGRKIQGVLIMTPAQYLRARKL